MTTSATELLLNNIVSYNSNPSSIQQNILDVLETVLEGDDVVDPTSPFIFLMEASATSTAAAIYKSQVYTNALYPKLGKTIEDLYGHISDKEFIGIYATPATSNVVMLIPWLSLNTLAISLTNGLSRSIVIPRNTEILVNDIALSIAYPIYINILDNEIVQTLYDTSEINPLLALSNNSLDNSRIIYNYTDYLMINIPVLQYNAISLQYPLLDIASFSQDITFTNQFCYCRAYIKMGNKWVEILTTHSALVYDISTPTVKLKVTNNIINVSLPDIYHNLGLTTNTIRIDVYTTLGELNTDLSQINSGNFKPTWKEFNTLSKNPAVAKLASLTDIIIYSESYLSGGTNGASFNEIKNQIIFQGQTNIALVRFTDIQFALNRLKYTAQKLIDSVTDRVIIASKQLPNRTVDNLSITPLASNKLVNIVVDTGLSNGINSLSITSHTTNRITIKPIALYKLVKGVIKLLPDTTLSDILSKTGNDLCNLLNSATYLYSPFHYIIDYTKNYVEGRAYNLQSPKIIGRGFKAINALKAYNIATQSSSLVLNDTGYRLILVASKPSGLTDINCQVVFYHKATGTKLHLTGIPTLQSNTVTFVFDFITTFDINQEQAIEITNLINGNGVTNPIFMDFQTTFNIFYLVSGSNVGYETNFDDLYDTGDIVGNVIGASYETITLQFGSQATGLYCPVKEVISTGSYVTYTATVYATYTEKVYAMDSFGKTYTINGDGTITFNLLHDIGDPILDEESNPIVLHYIGDYVLDSFGNKIPTADYLNSLTYSIGLTLIDAKYRFVTAADASNYATAIPLVIENYLNNELADIRARLVERTLLFYKPKGEPHKVTVNMGNKVTQLITALLDINITFYILPLYVNNIDIQENIRLLTRQIISNALAQDTISLSNIIKDLLDKSPSQVINIQINSFFENDATLVTLVDEGVSFNVRELLTVLPDGTLDLEDSITITYTSAT